MKTHEQGVMGNKEFIVLMAMLMSVIAISIDAVLPALGLIGDYYRLSDPNEAQFVIGALFFGMAGGQLVWGPLSDALGRKIVLYMGTVIYLVGTSLCLLAQDFDALLLGRFIQGAGGAAAYVTTVSIVRDRYAGREMARVMSVVMMIFILVPAIAPALGQAIMYLAGWREIFFVYLGYATLVALWIFLRMDETLPPENRTPLSIKVMSAAFMEVISNRITAGFAVCMGICFGSFLGYLNSSRQIFQTQFGVGDMFAVYFGGLALCLGAASMTNSRIVARYGMFRICLCAFMAIVVSSTLFLLVHWAGVIITLWMFLIYAACLFFCFGLVFGNLNAIAMEPMGHIAGMASAIVGAGSSLISMAIGGLIGQLYDGTLIPILTGFLLLGTLSIVIMVGVGRKTHL